jgi:hypothetical protein
MKKNEIGGACSTCGGEEGCLLGSLRERDHLEGLDVDVRIILK